MHIFALITLSYHVVHFRYPNGKKKDTAEDDPDVLPDGILSGKRRKSNKAVVSYDDG